MTEHNTSDELSDDFYDWQKSSEGNNIYELHLRIPAEVAIIKLARKHCEKEVTIPAPQGMLIIQPRRIYYEPLVKGIDALGIMSRYTIGIQVGKAFRSDEVLSYILKELNLSSSFSIPIINKGDKNQQ